jgi:glycosyltransferase involved in cell wall biosynthesis
LRKDKRIRVIEFARNFGKASALSAGFDNSKGDIIITMDADLQDDPDEIPRFLEKLKEYDLVVGWKYKRKDSITKKIASKIFNWMIRKTTKIKLHDSDCNFRAMKMDVIKNLNIYGGLFRYIPSLAYWKGFKIGEIKVKHHKRRSGKTKFKGVMRLIKGFLDLITINYLINYKTSPLYLFGFIGMGLGFIGFLLY